MPQHVLCCCAAIYNSVILDIRFPMAIYKKMLGMPVGLKDLKQLDAVCGSAAGWDLS